MMNAAPLVKPVMTLWDKNRTTQPRRSRPTPVYRHATTNASWITCDWNGAGASAVSSGARLRRALRRRVQPRGAQGAAPRCI